MVMAPIKSHTMSSQKGEPSDLAMPAGVRKMPTAMASPATAAAADPSPSSRRNPPARETAAVVCSVN